MLGKCVMFYRAILSQSNSLRSLEACADVHNTKGNHSQLGRY